MKEEKKTKTATTKKSTTKKKVVTKAPEEIKEDVIQEQKIEDNKNIAKEDTYFNLLEVVIIVLITGIIVSIVSGLIVYKNYDRLNIATNTREEKSELSEFIDNYNYIKEHYVEDVDGKELIEAAIEGMYNHLNDGYSMYLNKEDTNSLDEQLSGEYTGIGIEITSEPISEDKYKTTITKVFKDTPAEEAGLKVGDILLEVDGVEVTSSQMVADTIKKGNKESYTLKYERDGKVNTITIKRRKVYIESVSGKTYDNVGYIKIESFSATTSDQVEKVVRGFDKKVKSLVIDLRDNSGGYLTSANDISDLFVQKGKVIYQLKNKDGKISKHEAKSGVIRTFDKVAVIVNGGSASASEILTLALRDNLNAKVVGTTSYGKGTVQETKRLSSGAMAKYTIAYWLGPNGESINLTGIKPDIEVKESGKQLDEALKAVK